jgi:hypothetical protein
MGMEVEQLTLIQPLASEAEFYTGTARRVH